MNSLENYFYALLMKKTNCKYLVCFILTTPPPPEMITALKSDKFSKLFQIMRNLKTLVLITLKDNCTLLIPGITESSKPM